MWYSANTSCNFAWIMVILTYRFLNATLNFWKTGKSRTWQFLVSFLVFLNVLTLVNKILLLFLIHQARHEFGDNLQHFQAVFQNALNWTKRNSHHVSNFMDSESSIFGDKFLQSSHIPICFAHRWMSWDFRIFNSIYNTLNLETIQKVAFFPLFALQELLSSF